MTCSSINMPPACGRDEYGPQLHEYEAVPKVSAAAVSRVTAWLREVIAAMPTCDATYSAPRLPAAKVIDHTKKSACSKADPLLKRPRKKITFKSLGGMQLSVQAMPLGVRLFGSAALRVCCRSECEAAIDATTLPPLACGHVVHAQCKADPHFCQRCGRTSSPLRMEPSGSSMFPS